MCRDFKPRIHSNSRIAHQHNPKLTFTSSAHKTTGTPSRYFCCVMKRTITLLALLLTMAQSLLAGNPGTAVMFVTGNVTDKSSNETLSGVEVRVKGTNIVTYTDFDGNFYLPELAAG